MRSLVAVAMFIVALSCVVDVHAQSDQDVQLVANYYYEEGEVIMEGEVAPAAEAPKAEEAKEEEPKEEEEAAEEEDDKPIRFFNDILFPCLDCYNINIGGHFDAGTVMNSTSPLSGYNGPNTFADRDREFHLHQAYLFAEKTTKADICDPLDIGGRVDLLYGTDHRFTEARGLETHRDFTNKWNSGNRFYGLAMPQLYAEVAWREKTKIKLGHWYTPAGYEVVPSTGNFFYSHAYTHQYAEPFTHTGALTTYAVNDEINLLGGIHRGWDNWQDNNRDWSWLGGLGWTAKDKKTSLNWIMTMGDEDNAGVQSRFSSHMVITRELVEVNKFFCTDFSYVFASDAGMQQNAIGPGADATWLSFVHYLYYKYNNCWSFGIRYEWFRDDDGFRVAPVLPDLVPLHTFQFNPQGAIWQDITLGINYHWNANIVIRPEVRWDWVNDRGVAGGPYGNFDREFQFTAGVDTVMRF